MWFEIGRCRCVHCIKRDACQMKIIPDCLFCCCCYARSPVPAFQLHSKVPYFSFDAVRLFFWKFVFFFFALLVGLRFITLELWTVWNVKYETTNQRDWRKEREKEKRIQYHFVLFFLLLLLLLLLSFFFRFIFHWFIIFGLKATQNVRHHKPLRCTKNFGCSETGTHTCT